MLSLQQKMRTRIVLRRISLPRGLSRGPLFHKTSYRLSSSQNQPHSYSSLNNSNSNGHLHNLHGRLKDSTRYVTGTFISSFADSLAFYLVTFSAIGVGSYLIYRYVSQTIQQPFQRSHEKLQEKKNQFIQKVKDMKDSVKGTVTSMKETVVAGAEVVTEKMKDSVEVFKRNKSTEGSSSEALPSPASENDHPQSSPTEFLKAKAVTLKEKMSESLKIFGSQEEGQETTPPPPKESFTARAASWGKGLFQHRDQKEKKESEPE